MSNIKVITPPYSTNTSSSIRVFLAGSIEMGKAERWQDEVISLINGSNLEEEIRQKLVIFNPRRDDWDSSWKQTYEDPQFYQQVNWELNNLEKATHILYYFANDTLSPISLLELGKFYQDTSKTIVVVVGSNYQRKGNVDIFCDRYNITVAESLRDGIIKLFNSVRVQINQ